MAKGVISEFVDPSSYQQIEKLIDLLDKSKVSLSENISEAIKFNAAIGGSKSMKDFNADTEKAAVAMSKVQKAIEAERLAEIKLQQAREKAFDKFEAQLKKQEALQEKAAKAAQNNTEKQIKLDALAQKNRERTAAKFAQDAAKNSKVITEQSRVYNQLSVVLEKNRKDAKDIGVVYGENSVQFKKAAAGVVELDKKLKSIDALLGQHQRNVGNYRSGFNGLGNSINQLTREFPAFTFSVQTGFLALSNNLPIFFDEIKKTQDGIKAMRAEGQKVPGLLKQLATSFLSWGTVLSIGITLITVYGKEIGDFLGAIFQGSKAVNQFAERQKGLNEIYKKSNQEAGEQITTLKILYRATQDTTLSLIDRTKAAKELQKLWPDQFKNSKISAILNGEEKKSYDELTKSILASSRAKAAKEKIDELESKRLDNDVQIEKIKNATANEARRATKTVTGANQSSLTGGAAAVVVSRTKEQEQAIIRARGKTQIDLLEKNNAIIKNEQDFYLKRVGLANVVDSIIDDGKKDTKTKDDTTEKDRLQRLSARIQDEIDAAKEIAENEQNAFDLRTDALKKFLEKSKDLAENNQKIELLEKDLTAPRVGAIEDQKQRDINKAREEGYKIGNDILMDSLTEEQKIRVQGAQKILDGIKEDEAFRLELLNQAFEKGTITEKAYGELKLEIQREYAGKLINQEIENVRDLIKLGNLSVDERAEAEKKLAELKLKYAQLAADGQKDAAEKRTRDEIDAIRKIEEAEKKLADIKKQFQQEIRDTTESIAKSIVEGRFNQEQEVLNREADQIDKRAERETEAVNRSLATEEDKKSKLALIEARAEAQKEALELRQRQMEIRKAKFEKAANILSIGVNTAMSVAKISQTAAALLANPLTAAYAPIAFAQIPYAIGIGAAQAAAVLAIPIPKYKDGVKSSPEGLAIVGDGYQPELRIDPDGKYSLTPDKPTLTYTKAGTQIIGGEELKRMMAKPDKISYVGGQAIDLSELIKQNKESSKELKEVLKQRPDRTPIITDGGIKYIHQQGSKWNNYLRRNFN